jgi:hypothetical protein
MVKYGSHYCYTSNGETVDYNGKCGPGSIPGGLRMRIEVLELAAWNDLTMDEKLDDLRKRIEVLERGPVKF